MFELEARIHKNLFAGYTAAEVREKVRCEVAEDGIVLPGLQLVADCTAAEVKAEQHEVALQEEVEGNTALPGSCRSDPLVEIGDMIHQEKVAESAMER